MLLPETGLSSFYDYTMRTSLKEIHFFFFFSFKCSFAFPYLTTLAPGSNPDHAFINGYTLIIQTESAAADALSSSQEKQCWSLFHQAL